MAITKIYEAITADLLHKGHRFYRCLWMVCVPRWNLSLSTFRVVLILLSVNVTSCSAMKSVMSVQVTKSYLRFTLEMEYAQFYLQKLIRLHGYCFDTHNIFSCICRRISAFFLLTSRNHSCINRSSSSLLPVTTIEIWSGYYQCV